LRILGARFSAVAFGAVASFSFAACGSAALAAAEPGPPAADAGAPPPYATFVKGAEVQDGLFGVVRKDGKVYLAIKNEQLDQDFYEHATTANGLGGYGVLAGDDFEQPARIVQFRRINDNQVAVVLPQTRFEAQPGSPAATAIGLSTAESVLAVAPVAAEDKAGGKVVIDTSFLLGDTIGLGNLLSDIVKNPTNPLGGYHLDPSRSFFGRTKAFPENVIVEADQTFGSEKPDTIDTLPDAHSLQMRVKYNFAKVFASPDYVPRLADDRVGFWTNARVEFDRDDSYDNQRRYVIRWNLKASDPTKLSPAVKPIVYTITNTVPTEYRQAIRDALLQWNKAFERIGISDAIKVQDQPADPAFDDDDIRYNPIRWLTEAHDGGFAEAQLEWDPRTGEIFRSGILLDSDMMRFAKFDYHDEISPDAAARPHRGFLHRDAGAAVAARAGALALTLQGDEVPAGYAHDFLEAIVLHESGHDFGLAHNFIGHNAFTAAQLRDRAFTAQHGVASSVMEYSPANIWPKGTSTGAIWQTALGPYDYHVIHWGYAPVPGARTPDDEVPTLDRWAAAATSPSYAFASDEDVEYPTGHAVDPRISQFMLTGDSIGWCNTQLAMMSGLMSRLDARFPRPEVPWDQERFAFRLLVGNYSTCGLAMTHFIGGEHLSRARRGDPNAPLPLTPVSRDEEMRAFGLLDRYMFSRSAWHIAPATLRRMVYSEYENFDGFGYAETPRHDISLSDLVGRLQQTALNRMFAPLVLARIDDLPTKAAGARTMTLADLFAWTQSSVFGDLATAGPDPSPLRRNLQRAYARTLEHLAVAPPAGTPDDAQALALHELVAVRDTAARRLKQSALDLQTRAHLEALRAEINRTLEAKREVPPDAAT